MTMLNTIDGWTCPPRAEMLQAKKRFEITSVAEISWTVELGDEVQLIAVEGDDSIRVRVFFSNILRSRNSALVYQLRQCETHDDLSQLFINNFTVDMVKDNRGEMYFLTSKKDQALRISVAATQLSS